MNLRLPMLSLLVASLTAVEARGQARVAAPDTVVVQSGTLELRALLWRPVGRGPFPAVLFSHGSGPASLTLRSDRLALGPVFARHGYVFLFLFRRGSGLSATQGENSFDVMGRARTASGQERRNRVQLRLLETDDLSDALAGLAFLRKLPEVDAHRVAVVGHSFGGSLALLLTERDTTLRAAAVFGVAAGSWNDSSELRARLVQAVRRARAPIFFAHAANDLSVAPGESLAAEMQRVGRPHRLKIYPPQDRTAEEGHDFVFRHVAVWESDVFAFLNEQTRPTP